MNQRMIVGVPEGEEEENRATYKKFNELQRMNSKIPIPRHIIIKLLKDKERIFKEARVKQFIIYKRSSVT